LDFRLISNQYLMYGTGRGGAFRPQILDLHALPVSNPGAERRLVQSRNENGRTEAQPLITENGSDHPEEEVERTRKQCRGGQREDPAGCDVADR